MKDLTLEDVAILSNLSARILLRIVRRPDMSVLQAPQISINMATDWLDRMRNLELQARANQETKQ